MLLFTTEMLIISTLDCKKLSSEEWRGQVSRSHQRFSPFLSSQLSCSDCTPIVNRAHLVGSSLNVSASDDIQRSDLLSWTICWTMELLLMAQRVAQLLVLSCSSDREHDVVEMHCVPLSLREKKNAQGKPL